MLVFLWMFFYYLSKIVEVVRTLGILKLMNDKVCTILYRLKDMRTMRAAKLMSFRKSVIFRWRVEIKTDLAANLWFFLTIIPCEIRLWCITDRACALLRDVTFNSTKCRFNGFTIAFFVVRNKIIPLPVLFVGYDSREFINLEFLVLWRVGIIEVPLLEWNISTDEI